MIMEPIIKKDDYNVMDLFESHEIVKICAPMVRYSKLQFRTLARKYSCDLCYTPMILADSFCKSPKARMNEFTTNLNDYPLITQFAANTVHDFVGASYLVAPFCNGVDLNCGCPQRWARQQGLGCVLVEKPELIYDMARQCRNRISKPFTVSVKIRLQKDLKECVEICRQLEKCHVSFITVHARTSTQLTGEINEEALKMIAENCNIPVVANGGVRNLSDALDLAARTSCKGVMVANALLTNPTMLKANSESITSLECVQNWVDICYNSTLTLEKHRELSRSCKAEDLVIGDRPLNLTFQCFHHHLVFMLEKLLSRGKKRIFNNLQRFSQVFEFLRNEFEIIPELLNQEDFDKTRVLTLDYDGRDELYLRLKPNTVEEKNQEDNYLESHDDYDSELSQGKYFSTKTLEDKADEDACDWSNLFLENG